MVVIDYASKILYSLYYITGNDRDIIIEEIHWKIE
jgi:hypothetical protein